MISKTSPLIYDPNCSATPEQIAEAFPPVDPCHKPYGSRVIVQIRSPKTTTGRIQLPDDAIESEKWNTQIGVVRATGPGAFRNRGTGELWPEGEWCKIGDFVRIPKFNQDRWEVAYEADHDAPALGYEKKRLVLFVCVNDLDVLSGVTGNPLGVKSYI